MNAIEPTPDEKENAVRSIIDGSLIRPPNAIRYLGGLYEALGPRYIFWDTAEALSLAAVTAALLFLIQPLLPVEYKRAALFGCSPLLFVCILFFAETMECADRLYALKMTCKHTIRQVSVFRVLCFCAIGTVFSVGLTFYRASGVQEFLSLLPLSFCAFFHMEGSKWGSTPYMSMKHLESREDDALQIS